MTNYYFISFYFFYFIIIIQSDDINNTTLIKEITFTWEGGSPFCSSCLSGNYVSSFACNKNDLEWKKGNWENGTKIFLDPLLPSQRFILIQIYANLIGVFNCLDNNHINNTMFKIYLQNKEIFRYEKEPTLCLCANCVDYLNFRTKTFLDGFPSYNYGENNTLKIIVENHIVCLTNLTLTLIYSSESIPINNNSLDQYLMHIIIYLSVSIGIVTAIVIFIMLFFIIKRYKRKHYTPIVDRIDINNESENSLTKKFNKLTQIKGTEIKIGPKIGKGGFSEVFRAEWRGIIVAVKKLPSSLLTKKEVLQEFNKEAFLLSSLRHPNVLQFLGTTIIEEDLCLVTEFMSYGSVYRLLHCESFEIKWDLIKKFALDTAKGMLYLHGCNILHRDLKSQNLLVDETFKVKISDFGLSTVLDLKNDKIMTACGTAGWAAPEVLKHSKYTEKADVYSYAICLWEFWTRKEPYEGMPAFQIVFAVGTQELRPEIPKNCPSSYTELIVNCWNSDPLLRPTFKEIVERVQKLE